VSPARPRESEPVLIVKGLTVELSRNGRAACVLDQVGFEMAPGEIVALVGESGSGKSTIGLSLQGLLPIESQPAVTGSIRLAGAEIVGASQPLLRAARRSQVRAVPQDPMAALNPTMTIRRQLAESTDGDVSVIDWLRRTGLADPERIAESYPHRLSGGQRQRALIAMAMMACPKLLIADEPTSSLDVPTQAQILELLRDLARERQTATLFITHDLAVAASLADRIIVLYAGRIAEISDVREILATPAHPYSAGLLAARFDLDSDRMRPLPTLPAERRQGELQDDACAYALRCPLVHADCSANRPPLGPTPVHNGTVACFHAEQTRSIARRAPAEVWPAGMATKHAVVLRLSNVTKSFATGTRTLMGRRRPQAVLNGVSFLIRSGECVALVGESGAGKSTILRIAAGLVAPDSGEVWRIDNTRPQVVFQDAGSALTPWLSIGEQIGERLRPLGIGFRERRRRVGEALDLVGLSPMLIEALPGELSGGQRQRAVIARAVVVPPRLLLCDEPISAMDVSLSATTLNLLGDLRRRLGMAMLFVTHDLAAARIIADRIAVLRDGELIEDNDPDRLIAAPRTAYTRSLIAAVPRLRPGFAR
jgi:peptide/nickel transport system ATP-binding protein